MRALQRRYAAIASGGASPWVSTVSNMFAEQSMPYSWKKMQGKDPQQRGPGKRGLSSPEPLVKRDVVPNPAPKVEAQAADYDPSSYPVESEPHAWEKLIQQGKAVPSDEFGRKNFLLDTIKPDPNTNLFVQIIVDALEEAKAEDIVVIDTTNKWAYFPDFAEYIWLSQTPQRRMDMVVFASGVSAAHMNNIAASVIDKAKKGLIPCETTSNESKVDPTREEIYWKIHIPCGKIMVDISHPYRRDWKMNERKLACQVTEHAGRFVEDLLLDQGWVRAWDFWTPNAPCIPKTDFETVYAAERAHGWERVDVLKPEYVVTFDSAERKGFFKSDKLATLDYDNLSKEDLKYLRERLTEDKKTLSEPVYEAPGIDAESAREEAIARGELWTNFELKTDPTDPVTDEELAKYVKKLRWAMDHNNNLLKESPETRSLLDNEWAEYDRRREARIRKFGYYDYVELSNDMHRRRVILPDGVRTWDESTVPDFYITPHPENYHGKPRDTHWGPGWYDV